jgi:hypothetical protein
MKTLEAAQHIHILFEDSLKELLESLNCEVNMLPEHDAEWLDAPVSTIDAGSEDLEVKVALELPMSVLALTYPVPSIQVVDDESLEDWISELANQLIGRLKSKLMRHNEEIMLGLPSTTFGIEIDELIDPGPTRCSSYIEVDGEPCAFHIGVEFFTDDICFVNETLEVEDMVMESELELF